MASVSLFRSWFVAFVLIALLGACEQPNTSDVSQTEEGVFRLGSVEAVDTVARAVSPSGRPLVLDGFRGAVDLQEADQQTADLQFVRRGRGKDAETARAALENVTITESGTQAAYTYSLDEEGGTNATVDVSGTVPKRTALEVKKSTGAVSLTGIDGPLTVKHEHGPVTIRGAADSVTVEVRTGDVTAHFETLPSDAEVSLRTENGDVTLRLPLDASAQIEAETDAGAIRSQGLSLTDQHFTPRNAGGQYSAQLEPGEATVDLRTKNGNILITAGDSLPADTAGAAPEDTLGSSSGMVAPPIPTADTTVAAEATSDTVSVAPATTDTVGDKMQNTRSDTAATDTSGR